MLNLFQHPSCLQELFWQAEWMLKQVQHDEERKRPRKGNAPYIARKNRIFTAGSPFGPLAVSSVPMKAL